MRATNIKNTQNKNTKNNVSVPNVKRMTIEPAQAVHWLENANIKNRRISEKHVRRLARDMKDGKWMLTHEGIAFDSNGILLDGQHRLWAIIESDVSVDMMVWFDVDSNSMFAIDSGRNRSMADILNIAGQNGEVTNYQLSTLRAMLTSFGQPQVFSPSETAELLSCHCEAIGFAIKNLPHVASAKGISTAHTRAVVARAWYSVDHVLLEDFCRKLSTGIVTSKDERLIVLLRQNLQDKRGGSYGDRMNRYGKIQRVLKAWLKGENLSRLYPLATEQFPLPKEVDA